MKVMVVIRLQRFRKVLRYVKLNHFCYDNLFILLSFYDGAAIQLSSDPTKPIRIDNARNRTIGACAKVFYKWRMISSTWFPPRIVRK